ncbi:hypothetical protein GCM10009716_23730 [Streptomyces sodiiphilus]|uniref:Secreted protein n=1 Tax=Streptomyces sodiiphilus TaxID=226217 RepID=A0ABN2P5X5_9ACTN
MRITRKTGVLLASATAGALVLSSGAMAVGAVADDDTPVAEAPAEAGQPTGIEQLQDLREAIAPVTAALQAASAREGRLSQAEAERHTEAIREALRPLLEGAGQAPAEGQILPADDIAPADAAEADGARSQVDVIAEAATAGDVERASETLREALEAASALMPGLGALLPDLGDVPGEADAAEDADASQEAGLAGQWELVEGSGYPQEAEIEAGFEEDADVTEEWDVAGESQAEILPAAPDSAAEALERMPEQQDIG